ncbi:MAG: type II toxin-antitoxin system VapC family toxin [Crenarchaeota archaeon]|nr:type II toxin-antitoxin system VapC family toxin [Thermoproteota archaeon]
MAVLVDTGVLLAALIPRERRHRWARRLLAGILEGRYGPAYVTDYIVDEALSYAASRLGRDAAEKLLSLLVRRRLLHIIPVTIDVFSEAVEVYEAHLPRLSFTDATTLVVARSYRIDLIATLDRELAALHPSITPG